MRTNVRWTIFFLVVLLVGCRPQWSSVQEEMAFWETKVIKPSMQVLFRERNLHNALPLYDSLQRSTGQHGLYAQLGRYRLQSNYHYFFSGNNDAAGRYADSALALIHSPRLQQRYALDYVGLLIFGGDIAFQLSHLTKANHYYFLAKQWADRYLDPCQRSGFTYHVAMVAYKQQNYTQSAAYFREAYTAQATCPVQTGAIILQQQEIQGNIGLCMWQLKKYDSALLHFDSALAITRRHKDSLSTRFVEMIHGVAYGNMAKVHAARQNWAAAEHLFQKSVQLNGRPGFDNRDALLAQLQLAGVYEKTGRFAQMWTTLQAARAALDTIPDATAAANWNQLMFSYYQQVNRPLDELRHFKKYIALRDSIASQQKELAKADISHQLMQKEQALQIALLTRNNQLANVYFWVAVAFALMTALIIFLVYQNYRRTKRNMAALQHLNEQIRRQKEALEKTAREKDRILHVVAHDLRSPIGITAYVSDLILMEERSEQDRTWLQMIQEASRQALHLTNELVGIQVGGNNEKQWQPINLSVLVQTAVQMLQFKAAEKGQEVVVQVPPEAIFINGHPERLHRVLANLLDNAVKFSPRQGQITVALTREPYGALLAVADNGMGIPEAQQATIFDRFSAARRAGTGGEQSLGLGLSICREIVEQHGGSIYVKSTEGRGSTFFVRLPLAQDS